MKQHLAIREASEMKNRDFWKLTEKSPSTLFAGGVVPTRIPLTKSEKNISEVIWLHVHWVFLYLFWVLLSSVRKALEPGLDAILILATIRLVRPPYCVGEVDNLMNILIFAKDVRGQWARQHCRLTICMRLVELTNNISISIRWQDPNNNTDTEARCLV